MQLSKTSYKMDKQLKQIPKFAHEAEERAFWESHDSTDFLDWTKAKLVVLPSLETDD